ncbi:MAG: polyphenol oxidase family protein [Thermodesulfobacteriota bacterium]
MKSIPGVIHGIFTRHGGKSEGPFAELNLSYSVGDHWQAVAENRLMVLKALGVNRIQSLKQVHGKKVVEIGDVPSDDCLTGPEVRSGDILMSRVPGQGLLIKQADCQSVVLFDPDHRAIANIHCGWRGNVANVIGEAVEKLKSVYQTNPADLLAGIGPSLGPCCAQFVNYRKEIPPEYWNYQTRPFYFDLWRLSRDQLIAAGVREERIEVSGICTACQTGDFFSYRREKVTGRFATVIALL